MPKILTGKPTNVLTPFIESITAIANNGSGACRVTTAVAHEFADGDTVLITGTTQANLDNLYWTIAVIDATHFDLIGSTFSATHTGTATDVSLLPAIQCPLDGEAPTMNTLLPVLQALMDRTQYLQAKTRTSLVAIFSGTNTSNPTFTHNTYTPGDTVALQSIQTNAGDIIEVTITGFLQPVSGSNTLHIVTGEIQPAYFEVSSPYVQFASKGNVSWNDNTTTHVQPSATVSCVGVHTVATGGLLSVGINGIISTGDTEVVLANIGWLIRQWRPNQ